MCNSYQRTLQSNKEKITGSQERKYTRLTAKWSSLPPNKRTGTSYHTFTSVRLSGEEADGCLREGGRWWKSWRGLRSTASSYKISTWRDVTHSTGDISVTPRGTDGHSTLRSDHIMRTTNVKPCTPDTDVALYVIVLESILKKDCHKK